MYIKYREQEEILIVLCVCLKQCLILSYLNPWYYSAFVYPSCKLLLAEVQSSKPEF